MHTCNSEVGEGVCQAVEKVNETANLESWSTHRKDSGSTKLIKGIIESVAFALESLLTVSSCMSARYICLRRLWRVATGLHTRHASAIA